MIPIPPKNPPAGALPVIFAADQPPYDPLPGVFIHQEGQVLTEWEFTAEDLAKVLAGGRLRLWVWTFGQALQPVAVQVVE